MTSTFLVVDDDPVFNRVLSKSLENRGFHVLSAHTISEALELIKAQSPDYATIDLKLAQDSGLQLIPLIRAKVPDINMLVLTGYASIPTTVEAIKLGANNYLCKPANTREILQALNATQSNTSSSIEATPLSVEHMEWEHIQRVLIDNENNVSATARVLGMHRRTLQRKLQKHTSKH